MSAWLLMLVLHTGSRSVVDAYPSQDACEAAALERNRKIAPRAAITYICVQEGRLRAPTHSSKER